MGAGVWCTWVPCPAGRRLCRSAEGRRGCSQCDGGADLAKLTFPTHLEPSLRPLQGEQLLAGGGLQRVPPGAWLCLLRKALCGAKHG